MIKLLIGIAPLVGPLVGPLAMVPLTVVANRYGYHRLAIVLAGLIACTFALHLGHLLGWWQ